MKQHESTSDLIQLSRRAALVGGGLLLTGCSSWTKEAGVKDHPIQKPLQIGLITDLHYADKPTRGTRHYRDSLTKLDHAVKHINKANCHFTVELGDLIDAADDVPTELRYLKTIDTVMAKLTAPRHYVLGNHCVDTLSKKEFIANSGAQAAHYSWDHAGWHFIILDACYTHEFKSYQRKNFKWTDPNIPPQEIDWLKKDLKSTKNPTIVFVHQRLDLDPPHNYAVRQSGQVRKVLEESNKVIAVLQGHYHRNVYKEINDIHYCTLAAMVEGPGLKNNAYGLMELSPNQNIKITGFGNMTGFQTASKTDQ